MYLFSTVGREEKVVYKMEGSGDFYYSLDSFLFQVLSTQKLYLLFRTNTFEPLIKKQLLSTKEGLATND